MSKKPTFGDVFSLMMADLQLNKKQIADHLGITTMTLYNKVKEPSRFTIRDLVKMSELGIDIDNILNFFFDYED